MADDPKPPDPGSSSGAGDLMLWLGLLVILAAVIALVLDRRRARGDGGSGLPARQPLENPPQTSQALAGNPPATTESQALELEPGAAFPALAVASLETGPHSHKRIRRHPELRGQNGAAESLTNADL